jgi:hypothetical protein
MRGCSLVSRALACRLIGGRSGVRAYPILFIYVNILQNDNRNYSLYFDFCLSFIVNLPFSNFILLGLLILKVFRFKGYA